MTHLVMDHMMGLDIIGWLNEVGMSHMMDRGSMESVMYWGGMDCMMNRGMDCMVDRSMDSMMDRSMDSMMDRSMDCMDSMMNRSRDSMMNRGRDSMMYRGCMDSMMYRSRDSMDCMNGGGGDGLVVHRSSVQRRVN